MQYLTYDTILEGWEAETEAGALQYAARKGWSECETCLDNIAYGRYVDTVGGVEVYYDYGADYYFFCPED